ncbi:MAG: chemotaxis protein CheW [Candidatus Omnitrophota bacterium]
MKDKKDKIIIEVQEGELLEAEDTKKALRILTFKLGSENYGVRITQAKEVIKLPDVTRVPNTPEFIFGIFNLRGGIVTLVDIRQFFGIAQEKKPEGRRVIVTDVTGSAVGVLIDNLRDILDIEEELIQPPLATLKGKLKNYTKGHIQLGTEIIILLDLQRILKSEEMESLRTGGGE